MDTLYDLLLGDSYRMTRCDMVTSRIRTEMRECDINDVKEFMDRLDPTRIADINTSKKVSCKHTQSYMHFYDCDNNLKYSQFRTHSLSSVVDISLEVTSNDEITIIDNSIGNTKLTAKFEKK